MISRLFPTVLALSAASWGALQTTATLGQTQATPAAYMPPQQAALNGVPPSYPSTDPSTYSSPYPNTFLPAPNGIDGASRPSLMRDTGEPTAPYGSDPSYAPYGNLGATTASPLASPKAVDESTVAKDGLWAWQMLPTGLLYRPYLADTREPRLGTQLVYERTQGWLLDSTLGARAGLLRYGSEEFCPQGWQLDVEGAAFPRLDDKRNLVENDFHVGVPLTTRQGPWELKVGYVHYCSHIGDLYLLAHPDFERINYVRDAILWAVAVYPLPEARLYAESQWAFRNDGGSEPWEFEFGAEFCSFAPTGPQGSPFLAFNGHLREVNNFGGNMTMQTGWQWRGCTGHLLRIGVQYFNGMSEEGEFYNKYEEQIGGGLWYDF
jgi:hypothetical protein